MRHLFAIFCILLASQCAYAQAMVSDSLKSLKMKPRYLAKVDLVSPAVRTFQFHLERAHHSSHSFSLGILYTDQSDAITNASYLYRFAATLEHRYYMSKSPAPQGFYLASFLRYQWMRTDAWLYNYWYDGIGNTIFVNQYVTRYLNTFGVGLNLGYQRIFKEKIALDAYFGPVYNTGDQRVNLSNPYEYRPNESFKPYVGYFVRAGLSIGYVFGG